LINCRRRQVLAQVEPVQKPTLVTEHRSGTPLSPASKTSAANSA
jgi:hypothetical protein